MAFTPRTETYVNVSSLSTPFNATLNVPASTADGDIMFTLICWYAAGVTIDSVPGGWTLVGQQVGVNADRYALYYKIAASEPASYTWSFTATAKVRMVCSVYTAGDFNVQSISDMTISNTAYNTYNATCRAASISVPDANSPMVFFGCDYSTAAVTFTKPSVPTSGWIEDDDAGSNVPDFWTEICSFIWSGSGATGTMDATISAGSANKHAFAVALKPGNIIINEAITMAVVGSAGLGSGGSIYNPSIALAALASKAASGGMSFDDAATVAVLASVLAGAAFNVSDSVSLQAQAALGVLSTSLISAGISLASLAGVTIGSTAQMASSADLPATAAVAVTGANILEVAFNLAALAAAAAAGELVTGGDFYDEITMAATAGTTAAAMTVFNTLADLLAHASLTPDTTALLEAAVVMLAAALLPTAAEGGTSGEIAEVFIEIIRRRRGCR